MSSDPELRAGVATRRLVLLCLRVGESEEQAKWGASAYPRAFAEAVGQGGRDTGIADLEQKVE